MLSDAPTPTPTDPHTSAFEPTGTMEPVDRPHGAPDAGEPPAEPGRYLALERDGARLLLPLADPITHIGRGFAATVQLEDPGVSRRHAIVVQRRGGVRILDDRSANGTWVNGRRVTEAELRHGDVIVVGRVVLVFVDVPA